MYSPITPRKKSCVPPKTNNATIIANGFASNVENPTVMALPPDLRKLVLFDGATAVSYIGGAFGSKGPNPRTHWIARAARRIGRPVKLVPTRDQGFTIATYRAETRQVVKLAANEWDLRRAQDTVRPPATKQ